MSNSDSLSARRCDVAVIIGSKTDEPHIQKVLEIFDAVCVEYALSAISAHRNAEVLPEYCRARARNGTKVFLGAAGGSAHLPGVIKAHILNARPVPVVGLALPNALFGLDTALKSMIDMPSGVPVLTFTNPANAALTCCEIVAASDFAVRRLLAEWYVKNTKQPQIDFKTTERSIA